MSAQNLSVGPVHNVIRILCFGDSLTFGWTAQGAIEHPYAQALTQSLEYKYPTIKFSVEVYGLPGATVANDYMSRMVSHFPPHSSEPYDWVIVLGGTNDLSQGWGGESIYENLKKVWDVPIRHQTKVLGCTVTESKTKFVPVDEKRDAMNRLIRSHEDDHFYAFDLNVAFPYRSMSLSDQRLYWDDEVHPTAAGYDFMGEKIAAGLAELIEVAKPQAEN